ncbi:MAG: SMC-Scp complex subunit ScpB [Gammaproteobacteria bacterium]|nr:SMC-Scp complex subunit ScpB [Gammaproteobacteria bacterium]
MTLEKLKNILEAVLMAADKPMTVQHLDAIFNGDEDRPTRDEIRKGLHELTDDYADRGFELKQVASGFRIQVKQDYAEWVGRLWEEKPARYTRALLETMSLIAYRQPITRGEIEEVRGVSVSSNIIRTLQEREWIKVLGHKDVPGKPALYGTSREFLDYFNLKSLDELPSLAEIKDLDKAYPELALVDHHADSPDSDTDADAKSESEEAVDDAEEVEAGEIDDVAEASDEDSSEDAAIIDQLESEEAALEGAESEDIDDSDADASAASNV